MRQRDRIRPRSHGALPLRRGHTVTAGAELTHSRTARTLRGHGDALQVTDGPYAEGAEQLGGFYLVSSDDLEDLVEVTKILAGRPSTDLGPPARSGPAATGQWSMVRSWRPWSR